MKKSSYLRFVAMFFLAIAVAHGLRFFFDWDAQINGWVIPRWLSLLALLIGLWLTRVSLRMARR